MDWNMTSPVNTSLVNTRVNFKILNVYYLTSTLIWIIFALFISDYIKPIAIFYIIDPIAVVDIFISMTALFNGCKLSDYS
jgi:hypothetical protein